MINYYNAVRLAAKAVPSARGILSAMRTRHLMIFFSALIFLLCQDVMAESRLMRCAGKLIKVGDF